MKTIKRLHRSRSEALAYIDKLSADSRFYRAYKLRIGKFWVGTELEWLNRY